MNQIADMLIRVKNAQRAGHARVRIPYSRLKYEIAHTLERAGFVVRAERKGKRTKKILEVQLPARGKHPSVNAVEVISKPSRRRYVPLRELRSSPRGGIIILSTSKGVMSEKEARAAHVGGEVIAEIW